MGCNFNDRTDAIIKLNWQNLWVHKYIENMEKLTGYIRRGYRDYQLK